MKLSIPKYRAICDALVQEIRDGVHAPGTKFTTAQQIQKRFRVSSITAKHALNQLRDLGLVERRRWHGTLVRAHPLPPKTSAGNLVGAAFRHTTSRALDPQLHTHFVLFNCMWDKSEKRWKALPTGAMFGALNYGTAVYRNSPAVAAGPERTRPPD